MCTGGSWHAPTLASFALQGGAIAILTAAERPNHFSGMVLISPLVLANPESATTFKVNRLPILGDSAGHPWSRVWGEGPKSVFGLCASPCEGLDKSQTLSPLGDSMMSEVRCVLFLRDERQTISC